MDFGIGWAFVKSFGSKEFHAEMNRPAPRSLWVFGFIFLFLSVASGSVAYVFRSVEIFAILVGVGLLTVITVAVVRSRAARDAYERMLKDEAASPSSTSAPPRQE